MNVEPSLLAHFVTKKLVQAPAVFAQAIETVSSPTANNLLILFMI
jgi:hypothetical protein